AAARDQHRHVAGQGSGCCHASLLEMVVCATIGLIGCVRNYIDAAQSQPSLVVAGIQLTRCQTPGVSDTCGGMVALGIQLTRCQTPGVSDTCGEPSMAPTQIGASHRRCLAPAMPRLDPGKKKRQALG